MRLTRISRYVCCVRLCCAVLWAAGIAYAEPTATLNKDMTFGIPFGASMDDSDYDLCPEGVRVVGMFLQAWQRKDYPMMYELLDDKSKEGYPFAQARIDFQFLEYKEYKISSVRKYGDDFEFILSYGDWKDGDKDVKKMIISGETFKIIMPSKSSPFKESLANYF